MIFFSTALNVFHESSSLVKTKMHKQRFFPTAHFTFHDNDQFNYELHKFNDILIADKNALKEILTSL